MADFAAGNARSYFSPGTTYPGSLPMEQALQQYFRQLMGNQSKGPGQLAASNAAQGPAQQYQLAMATGAPMAGSEADGIGAYGNLMAGNTASREAGMAADSQTKLGAEQGIENVGNAYGGDITSNIEAQMALNKAKQAESANSLSNISNLIQLGGSILFDPANVSGQFGQHSLTGTLGLPSANGISGSMGGGTGNTGSPAGAYGYTPVQPGGTQAQNLAAASNEPWLNPNDIAGVSGASSTGGGFWSGLMSSLGFLGA